jgi:hypothetical protein
MPNAQRRLIDIEHWALSIGHWALGPVLVNRTRPRTARIAARSARTHRRHLRRGRTPIGVRGKHRQATLKLGAVTRGALGRLATAHQNLELLVAFFASVLKQRHTLHSSRCDRPFAGRCDLGYRVLVRSGLSVVGAIGAVAGRCDQAGACGCDRARRRSAGIADFAHSDVRRF